MPKRDVSPPAVGSHPLLREHFLNILEAYHDGIQIIDADTVAVYINPRYTEITGIKAEDMIGKVVRSTRPHALISEVVRTGRSMPAVYRKEGDVEYLADISPVIGDGKVMGAVSVIRDITEVRRLTRELQHSRRSNRDLRSSLRHLYKTRYTFNDILGESAALQEVVRLARSIASINADVLIYGESGTGKELFAQAIHNASSRAGGPFIAFNCAALTPSVMESELFGYADGAFTGAQRGGKEGFFTVAEGGTLLLDEISELSLEGQGKLLRVLQERAVRPVGQAVESPIDVRIIAATNKNLRELMDKGLFREDLFYRLNVLHLDLPPLRARTEDTFFLARYFARRIAGRYVPFASSAEQAIAVYPWPGNIRELYNAIQYALHMSGGECVSAEHLPRAASHQAKPPPTCADTPRTDMSLAAISAEAECRAIEALLSLHGRDMQAKKKIADILRISLATLYNKIREHRL